MNKLFVDTNIIIDLLSKRELFYEESQELFSFAADNKNVILYVSALTFANTHYILLKFHNTYKSREILSKFKTLVKVIPLDDDVIEEALNSKFKDFEDAIQYYTALKANVDFIITRNKKDFKASIIPVLTAKEYLNKFQAFPLK